MSNGKQPVLYEYRRDELPENIVRGFVRSKDNELLPGKVYMTVTETKTIRFHKRVDACLLYNGTEVEKAELALCNRSTRFNGEYEARMKYLGEIANIVTITGITPIVE